MREIVNIFVGQCGTQIGKTFTEVVCNEHGIDPTGTFYGENEIQLDRIDVYFQEGAGGKYIPRSVLIDLEPMELIRGTLYGKVLRPDNFIFAQSGAGNNYARGYWTEGRELLDEALVTIRKEVEMCESMQGFQFVHSVGGGTGGGMGSLLLDTLREDYTDRCLMTWSLMPAPEVSEVIVEPYNEILAIHHLIDGSDLTFCVDNTALGNICRRSLRILYPMHADFNYLISPAMAGVTAAHRFSGPLNADIRKIATSTVPFPRLHFFIPGYAPLVPRGPQDYRGLNVPELVQEMFSYRSHFVSCDPRAGKYLAAASIFRGRVSSKQVEESVFKAQNKYLKYFAPWIPNNVKVALCDIPPRGLRMSSTFFGNNTTITCLWKRILETYNATSRRKAFLHWFVGEGMDEEEFHDAVANLEDLINEYQLHEDNYELPYHEYEDIDNNAEQEGDGEDQEVVDTTNDG